MESQKADPIAASPVDGAASVAKDAAEVGDVIVRAWREIDTALSPIIGRAGVAALFKRSLHLASRAHPCLAVNQEGVQAPMDLAALGTVLAQQGSGSAAAAGRTHLQVFYKLLTDLVGPSLTEQLLGTAWAKHLDGLVEDSLP